MDYDQYMRPMRPGINRPNEDREYEGIPTAPLMPLPVPRSPGMMNPDMLPMYPDMMNPDMMPMYPDMMNPDMLPMYPDMMNPDMLPMYPDMMNPDMLPMYPDMMNPGMMNPGMMNPDMMNPMMGRGCPYMNNYLMPTMPVTYSETDMDEKDMEYMKHLHSEICKKIQPHIEAECDRMDHEDSPLYREYPDRETIEQMVDRICACVEENMKIQGESVEAMQEMAQQYGYGNRQDLLRSLVGALLLSEIFGRRRPRRRRRRRFDRYNFPY